MQVAFLVNGFTIWKDYFCFTAIAEISIRALFTNAATCTVARADLCSGMMLLYTLFIFSNVVIAAEYRVVDTMYCIYKAADYTWLYMFNSADCVAVLFTSFAS